MAHRELTERGRKVAGIVAGLVFIGFCLAVALLIGRPMLAWVDRPEQFRAWVDEHGIRGRLVFVGMVVLQVVVALIPGEPLEMGAGYAFGALEGTLLCLCGTVLGSLLVWGLVKRFGVRLLEVFFPRERIASLRFLQNERRVEDVIFLIMLLPGTPKDLLCYFVPLTRIPLSHWLLISAIARIPSVVSSTISGSALGERNYTLALVALAITAALSLCGLVIYRLIGRRRARRTK